MCCNWRKGAIFSWFAIVEFLPKNVRIKEFLHSMITIRGATSVDVDEEIHISERVCELFDKIMEMNALEKIYAIFFSVTPDIRSINPASIVRVKYHLSDIALMCLQEASFVNSAPRIIRTLILAQGTTQQFIYLHEASKLREDLSLPRIFER